MIKFDRIAVVVCLMGLASMAVAETSLEKMNRDKLGMFIHWGVYSVPADGEWVMNVRNIPKEEYARFADLFRQPKSFSPREWVLLAKRMGARYAVLTTRHHDGFALWDTKTTDFNSVKTAARRDYVREFCEACRAEGIRVGLYYSLMNWQYWRPGEPYEKSSWEEQVRVTHEGLRELMTDYGTIDYLWYDGCLGPGLTDSEAMERLWHSADLNAMVRKLQPGILINDRSASSEDYSTPEQSLQPPPTGRAWESCITCNRIWGYRASDTDWKSSDTLFRSLLHCARFGGNLLVNIGPRADGSVPEGCVRSLEGLGKMIAECPESIYGSERDAWTEATHEAGVVTKANGSYWLWALNSTKLDGARRLEQVGPHVYRVMLKEGAKPCNWLGGRHDVALKAGDAPILGDDTDGRTPPNGEIELTDDLGATSADFTVPVGGKWRLELGYVTREGFKDTSVEEIDMGTAGGKRTVIVPIGGKGVYAKRVTPVWTCVVPKVWEVAGVFPTEARAQRFTKWALDDAWNHDFVEEAKKARFVPVSAANDLADRSDTLVNFNYSAPNKGVGYALARYYVECDRDESVYGALGCDWWGKAYVNGVEALPRMSGWKPKPFVMNLKKGRNEILVVIHCGMGQHYFSFYTNR